MAGINRFMTPARLPQIGSFFQLPFEAMAKTIETAQKQNDAVKTGLYQYAGTDFNYLDTDNERKNAEQIYSELDKNLQTTLSKQKNGDLRGLTGDVLGLQADLAKRTRQGGDIYTMQTNYNTYVDWYNKQREKQDKLAPGYLEHASSVILGAFDSAGGSLGGAKLPIESLIEVPNAAELAQKYSVGLQAAVREKYGETIGGAYGGAFNVNWSNAREYLTPEEIQTVVANLMESDPQVYGWLVQASKFGYISPEQAPITLGTSEYTHPFYKEKQKYSVLNPNNPFAGAIYAVAMGKDISKEKDGYGYTKNDLWYYQREQEQKMKEAIITPTVPTLSGDALKTQIKTAIANKDFNTLHSFAQNKLIQYADIINQKGIKGTHLATEIAAYNIDAVQQGKPKIQLGQDGTIHPNDLRALLIHNAPKVVDKNKKIISPEDYVDAYILAYGERIKADLVEGKVGYIPDPSDNIARGFLEGKGYTFRTGAGNILNERSYKGSKSGEIYEELELSNREGLFGFDLFSNDRYNQILGDISGKESRTINTGTPNAVLTSTPGYQMPGDLTYDTWEQAAKDGTLILSESGSTNAKVGMTMASSGVYMKNIKFFKDPITGDPMIEGPLFKKNSKGQEVAVMSEDKKTQAWGRVNPSQSLNPYEASLFKAQMLTQIDQMESGAQQEIINNITQGTFFGGSSPYGPAANYMLKEEEAANTNRSEYFKYKTSLPPSLDIDKVSMELATTYNNFIVSNFNKADSKESITKSISVNGKTVPIEFIITKVGPKEGTIKAVVDNKYVIDNVKQLNTGTQSIKVELPNVYGLAIRAANEKK